MCENDILDNKIELKQERTYKTKEYILRAHRNYYHKHKDDAESAKEAGDHFSYHMHMADHHGALADWHYSKGRNHAGDKHSEKAADHEMQAHAIKSVKKEEVAVNNVGDGNIAGTKGDAGKKAVMTKEPLKRQPLKNFKEFNK